MQETPSNFEGIGSQAEELVVAHLVLLGHDVRILAPALTHEDALPEEHVYNVGWTIPFSMNGTTADIAVNPAMPGRVHQILEREVFDIVHIHEPLLPGLPLVALRASKAVRVGTFHAYPYDERYSLPALAYSLAAPLLSPSFRRL